MYLWKTLSSQPLRSIWWKNLCELCAELLGDELLMQSAVWKKWLFSMPGWLLPSHSLRYWWWTSAVELEVSSMDMRPQFRTSWFVKICCLWSKWMCTVSGVIVECWISNTGTWTEMKSWTAWVYTSSWVNNFIGCLHRGVVILELNHFRDHIRPCLICPVLSIIICMLEVKNQTTWFVIHMYNCAILNRMSPALPFITAIIYLCCDVSYIVHRSWIWCHVFWESCCT